MAKIDALLQHMTQLKASDMHLTVGCPPTLRIHGELQPLGTTPLGSTQMRELLCEIWTDDQRDHFERNFDLDFGYTAPGPLRFRGNAFLKSTGIAAAFRQIPTSVSPLSGLGFPPVVEQMCDFKNGLVLVTGPTGSGKSTTLAAMINRISQHAPQHIITLEDPIEFVHEPKRSLISQREIGRHCLSFSNGLRAALREDPDVIMVGEMRDLETISFALTAAETGHLVFSTLHTRNSSKTVDRIIDVFPPDKQMQIRTMLSESLRGVISQVLLKRADEQGRVAAFEILVANTGIRALIREHKTFQIASAISTGRREGMQSLDQHLLELLQQGIISPDEAIKACDNPASFQRYQHDRPMAVAA